MTIELKEVTVSELVDGFIDNDEGGVVGYMGKLDIRPPYQREFIYKDKEREMVVDTIVRGFPLNVMYWAVRNDGSYEVLDGQQRTMSICQYVTSLFSYKGMYYHNLPSDVREKINEYKLMVYICSGADSEKLDWFRTINIAGLKLKDQELRNAVYNGSWIIDAKKYFSKHNCPAHGIAKEYLSGEYNRQDYLETAIKWISNGNIEEYMAVHQHDANANELWLYFNKVVSWVNVVFPKTRKELMKGLQWGYFYNQYGNENLDSVSLEKEIRQLIDDEDVTNKRGVYEYVLSRKEKHLNLRQFSPQQRREAYERQNGICPLCGDKFNFEDMEADHITPWHEGGTTTHDNCQMLCKSDNRTKGGR